MTSISLESSKGKASSWKSPTEGTNLPYDFVPVVSDEIKAEEPVWHDGSHQGSEELYSGELWCTLTTLTPTIVGNQHFELEDLDEQVRTQLDACRVTDWKKEQEDEADARVELAKAKARGKATPQLLASVHKRASAEIEAQQKKLIADQLKKKLLAPLRASFLLGNPVLIAGESIAGMARHSVGALMNAPLERVQPAQPESFSYRPNTDIQPGRRSKQMAGMVEEVDLANLTLKICLFAIDDVMFVRGSKQVLETLLCPNAQYPIPCAIGESPWGWKFVDAGGRTRIERDPGNRGAHFRLDEEHLALRYQFGTPGGATDEKGHHAVLVPLRSVEGGPQITVARPVVRQYLDTLKLWDVTKEDRGVRKGDIIFCEVVDDGHPPLKRVISFGANFRYRWKQLNGVTSQVTEFDDERGDWVSPQRRPEISPHQDEKADARGRPSKLTAVRNMFGYVIDKKSDGPLCEALPKLRDPFDHMAGRVSFNFAVERVKPDEPDEARFVNAKGGRWVFLHPTVEPKPQHERGYVPGSIDGRGWGGGILLREDTKQLLVQNITSLFAGRKFYLHQGFDTQSRSLKLAHHHFDLLKLLGKAGQTPKVTAHTRWEILTFLWGTQSQVARDVSMPGREFGFAVRFKQLRGHELAALAVALDPGLVAEEIQGSTEDKFQEARKALGNKLGHGRALGLGSVKVAIDGGLRWPGKWSEAESALDRDMLKRLVKDKLLPRLNTEVLEHWLRVLSIQPCREAKPYLFAHEGMTMTKWAASKRNSAMGATRNDPFQAA